MGHVYNLGQWFILADICFKTPHALVWPHGAPFPLRVLVSLPSESSSSSSASFSRTSAGRVMPTAVVGSNIIVSNPEEVLSAMVVQYEPRQKVRFVAGDYVSVSSG